MDLRKAFATDKRAETEGRKLYLDKDKDIWLLIARRGNANYKAYTSKVFGENQTMLATKTPEAEALATQVFKEASARFLLIGWSPTGIDLGEVLALNDDGSPKLGAEGEQIVLKPYRKDVPYSYEASKELIDMDDFDDVVTKFASDMANYRTEEVIKTAKNSKST